MNRDIQKDIEKIISQKQNIKQLLNLEERFSADNSERFRAIDRNRLGAITEMVFDEKQREETLALFIQAEEMKQSQSGRLIAAISKKKNNSKAIIFKISSIAVAAAIVAISALVFNYFATPKQPPIAEVNSETMISRPTLFLPSGEKISLTANADLTAITKRPLMEKSSSNVVTTEVEEMCKVIVPIGCTSTVTLADGTKIHLNSKSELIYSSHYDITNRKVFLKGEACFEVVKSTEPFVVEVSNEYSVKVYGTEFTVNSSYGENIETTLLSGSVSVLHNQTETMITPNKKFIYNPKNKTHEILEANSDSAKAWLFGKFISDKESLEVLLNDISNWYNVSFEYQDVKMKDLVISSVLYKDTSIERIISIIENSINVRIINEKAGKYMIEHR